ncbi:MAG: hypothetical protein AAGI38_06820 [Bacteroidota bacterium]
MKTRKAATSLLFGKQLDSIRWKLVSTLDPYTGNARDRSAETKYLQLHDDGTYHQWDQENDRVGKYFLKKDESAIALIENSIADTLVPKSLDAYQYRYKIEKLGEDTMILSIQGRHGRLREVYVREGK